MKNFGAILVLTGVVWALFAFFMETTVNAEGAYSNYLPSRSVHNIGLMERRRTHLTLAGFTALAGVVLFGFGSLGKESVSGPTRTCPKCAESILAAASKCRHCGADIESVAVGVAAVRQDVSELERILTIVEHEFASVELYMDALKAAGGSLTIAGSIFNRYYLATFNGTESRIATFAELKPWCLERLKPLVNSNAQKPS